MDITVTHDTLLRALRTLGAAMSRANPSRYSSLGINAHHDAVTLRAASTAWDARYTIPAQVHRPGETWVPTDLFRALPWAQLTTDIGIRVADGTVAIASGDTAYTIAPFAPEHVVQLRQGRQVAAILPGTLFSDLLRLGAAALPHGQADLEGAWLYTDRGSLSVASTDRVRSATATAPATVHADLAMCIPAAAVLTLIVASRGHDAVTLYRHPSDPSPTLTLVAGPAVITLPMLAERAPDPRPLRVPCPGTTLQVETSTLLGALRTVLAIAGTDPAATVRLRTQRAQLLLSVTRREAQAATKCPVVRAQGHQVDLHLAAHILQKALAPIGGTVATLGIGAGREPLSVEADAGEIHYRAIVALQAATDAAEEAEEPATIPV